MNRFLLFTLVLLNTLLISAQIERADSIMAAEYSIKSIDANSKYISSSSNNNFNYVEDLLRIF